MSVMQIGQVKTSARGPLIAVIKIEIDTQRTDRIFLHQRDNDLKLAEMFVEKHTLNPALTDHIYQRIKFSRQNVELNDEPQNTERGRNTERKNSIAQDSKSYYKMQTPTNQPFYNNQEEQYNDQQSFGTGQSHLARKNQQDSIKQEKLFTIPKNEQSKRKTPLLNSPNKNEIIKDKQFLFYDCEDEQEQNGVNLFPNSKKSYFQKNNQFQSNKYSNRAQNVKQRNNVLNSQAKFRKAFDIIEQQQKQQKQQFNLKSSRSMTNFKSDQQPVKMVSTTKFTTKAQEEIIFARNNSSAKPLNVKILGKEEMDSMRQSLRKSMSKQDISRINRDVTRRLYNEADIKKNYLNIIKEKAKRDRQKAEDAELTHKPEINKISKVIAQGRKKAQVPVEVYLMEQGKKIQSKRAQKFGRKALEQIESCSFQPQLNIISKKLASDREGIESRMKMRESSRRQIYEGENTHRPVLNEITKELMREKGRFEERQKEYLQQRNSRLVELVREKIRKEKIDSQTGQQLFKPVIKDVGIRENQGQNIGNYLHNIGRSPPPTEQAVSPRPRISESSELLVRQMCQKRIAWLFSELDSDQDGVISSQKINIGSVSPQLLDIIKPILFQMQEIQQQLTLEQFRNAVQILHNRLNAGERSVLYGYRQKCK